MHTQKTLQQIKEEVDSFNKEWIVNSNKKILEDIKVRENNKKNNVTYKQSCEINDQIISPFIKQHLEAKITAARWGLALGVAATALFKGQWLLWISFIITYFLYVNKIKSDAIEADKRRKEFGKKK